MRPIDMTAPLPLGYHRAIQQAVEIRREHPFISYNAIGVFFERYHGISQGEDWWRRHMIAAGAVRQPRKSRYPKAAA